MSSSQDIWDRAFGPKDPGVLQKLLEGASWRIDSRESAPAEHVAISLDSEGKTVVRALRVPADGGGWAFVFQASKGLPVGGFLYLHERGLLRKVALRSIRAGSREIDRKTNTWVAFSAI